MAAMTMKSMQTRHGWSEGFTDNTAPSYVTSPLPGDWGTSVMKIAGGTTQSTDFLPSSTTSRQYYLQTRWCFASGSAGTNVPLVLRGSLGFSTIIWTLKFDASAKTLTLADSSGTAAATTDPLSADTYYTVEVRYFQNIASPTTGELELKVNGTTIGSSSSMNLTASGLNRIRLGDGTTSLGVDQFFSEVQANDDQGASNNSWVNGAKIGFLFPVSDNDRVGYTVGGGGTTNLFEAVNNAPPVGVASASATATSQIVSANNNNTDYFTANLARYTDPASGGGLGMGLKDIVRVVAITFMSGQNSVTLRTTGGTLLTNPTTTESTSPGTTVAEANFPTGWRGVTTANITENPSVNLSVMPTMKARKGSATTDSVDFCLMGAIVRFESVGADSIDPGGHYI